VEFIGHPFFYSLFKRNLIINQSKKCMYNIHNVYVLLIFPLQIENKKKYQ